MERASPSPLLSWMENVDGLLMDDLSYTFYDLYVNYPASLIKYLLNISYQLILLSGSLVSIFLNNYSVIFEIMGFEGIYNSITYTCWIS